MKEIYGGGREEGREGEEGRGREGKVKRKGERECCSRRLQGAYYFAASRLGGYVLCLSWGPAYCRKLFLSTH